ncbi:hypothetical protein PCASD_15800 [Puccinia coronata f. sp. avenae]|uniref:Uncharacterized protein n=1 Tax=Puccinia coronata f. sp. avenae TaxID=200324 RepID=A0A2N5TTS2_9BASI|nr:hypothetical protein PCASD_15800 [Puccinia coronata f. sp. avenae]
MDSLAIRILINVMSSHNVSSHFQFLQIITGQYEFACLVLQSKIFLRVFCIGRLLNVDTHSMSTSRQAMRSKRISPHNSTRLNSASPLSLHQKTFPQSPSGTTVKSPLQLILLFHKAHDAIFKQSIEVPLLGTYHGAHSDEDLFIFLKTKRVHCAGPLFPQFEPGQPVATTGQAVPNPPSLFEHLAKATKLPVDGDRSSPLRGQRATSPLVIPSDSLTGKKIRNQFDVQRLKRINIHPGRQTGIPGHRRK